MYFRDPLFRYCARLAVISRQESMALSSGALGYSKCTPPAKWSLTLVSSSSPTPLPEPWSFVYAPVPRKIFQVKESVG